MWTLFVFGSIGFYILAAIEVILLAIFVDDDHPMPGWAGMSFIVSLLVLNFFGTPIIQPIIDDPSVLFEWGVIYIAVGLAWSLGKYYFYLIRRRRKFKEKKDIFFDINPEKKYDDWLAHMDHNFGYSNSEYTEFGKNKPRIIFWMTYWPFSLLSTLLKDIVRKMFEEIYEFFSGLFKEMFRKVMKEQLQDFEKLKEFRDNKKKE
ncbi:MAG: hypothetical protein KAS32_11135 [Candidatus Peribacteraceae bacterium]|nr:hypothetical protein [Candidatus Peribacteraceae bacterium]